MEHESSKRLVLEGVSSTATPHTKRQCYAHHNVTPPNACDAGSFLSNLNEATTTGGPETPTKEPEIGDEMQQRAIALANQGHNLFLTGRAGKSWATKRIIKEFGNSGKRIHATAPTGIAAINVDGTTIHNWGRFNLGQYYDDFKSMWEENTRKMIQAANALLIDEISMLNGHLFDVLECMVTIIRCYDDVKAHYDHSPHVSDEMLRDRWTSEVLGSITPWGGLQLIVVGDFFQLPPVPAGQDQVLSMSPDELDLKIGRQGCYAFESHAWMNSGFKTVELVQVHRQAEGDGLFDFLNDIREGHLNDLVSKHHAVIQTIQRPFPSRTDGIISTELHSKNVVVDTRNREELDRINEKSYNFDAKDEVALDFDHYMQPYMNRYNLQFEDIVDDEQRNHLMKLHGMDLDKEPVRVRLSILAYDAAVSSPNVPEYAKETLNADMDELRQHCIDNFFAKGCRVAEHLELKQNAQVMLLWNLDVKGGLANGSRGIVKGFFPIHGYLHLLQAEIKRRDDERRSGGKVQAQSSESALLDTEAKIENENDLIAKDPSEYDFSSVDKEILAELQQMIRSQGDDKLNIEIIEMEKIVAANFTDLPYILFTNGRRHLLRPQPFSKTFKKCGTAIRAVTIHKAQGLTIDLLHVDLSDCFADGQAYVACSRGRSLDTMYVKNFKPTAVKTSKKVITFYKLLKRGEYYKQTWADTIDEFDRGIREQLEKKREMQDAYSNISCDLCGEICVVKQIKSSRNNNQGKWFASCPLGNGFNSGHTWKLLGTSLPKRKPYEKAMLHIPTPGAEGTNKDCLKGKNFVLTGVFPTLGGGDGLALGKDKLKQIITSFGGAVTGGISGKTDYVVVGEEPGAKKLEQAKARGVQTIDLNALMKMACVEVEASDEEVQIKHESQNEYFDV